MDIQMDLIGFLEKLEECKLYYRLSKIREGILVEITVPGERWEVEFMRAGVVVIEKFKSDLETYDESELSVLFDEFSDWVN